MASEPAAYPDRQPDSSVWSGYASVCCGCSGFSSGIVFYEPAPYEFLLMLAIGVFALTGLKIRAAHVPLLIMMIGTDHRLRDWRAAGREPRRHGEMDGGVDLPCRQFHVLRACAGGEHAKAASML